MPDAVVPGLAEPRGLKVGAHTSGFQLHGGQPRMGAHPRVAPRANIAMTPCRPDVPVVQLQSSADEFTDVIESIDGRSPGLLP